jgi:endonuclease/exonuclease/phosphatase family metal-dependent hydrolase
MKKLSFLDKILFLINSILAFLLLVEYCLPYISPKTFTYGPVITLGTPLFILLNFIAVVYWIIKLKKQFLLSSIVLLIGYNQMNALIKFKEKKVFLNDDIKIMSYNVRLFNVFESTSEKGIKHKIERFIHEKSPDILVLQEYYKNKKILKNYSYKYIKYNSHNKNKNIGMAIYSKYPIISSGHLSFESKYNNAIFADIKIKTDTIRIYNTHLHSIGLNLEEENFGEKTSENLIQKLSNTFSKQQTQVEKIIAHQNNSPYKNIILGDFNNNAFSWAYSELSKNKRDAFIEAGAGLGKSYNYFIPLRIDFMLMDEQIKINNFKTYNVKYSDHYPIMARINLTK